MESNLINTFIHAINTFIATFASFAEITRSVGTRYHFDDMIKCISYLFYERHVYLWGWVGRGLIPNSREINGLIPNSRLKKCLIPDSRKI